MSEVAAEAPPSYREALQNNDVRVLAVSRAASKLAQSTVSYGSMVYLATQGATQFQISAVSASTYLAALLFGLQGGTLADSLSKRLAIIAGYIGQAALCILIPIFFGTDVLELMTIMFMSSALMQLISPSLKSAVALVASPREMASVSALVSVVGSIASAIGSSLLAPMLIKVSDIRAVLFLSGLIYLLGAIRTLAMPAEARAASVMESIKSVDWRPNALSMRFNAEWIVKHRDVATVILTGAIVVSLFEAFNTMIPVYIRDVLDADPANAVYIFAPAGIGFLIGMFWAPAIMHRIGERKLALIGAISLGTSMLLFGLIDHVDWLFAPISPLRLIGWAFDIEISDQILAASVIAIPANFGSTVAGASVQTYINRNVPVINQGGVFGLEEVQENAFTLFTIMVLGVLSGLIGTERTFIFAPIVALFAVLWLIRYSNKSVGQTQLSYRESLSALTGQDVGKDSEEIDI